MLFIVRLPATATVVVVPLIELAFIDMLPVVTVIATVERVLVIELDELIDNEAELRVNAPVHVIVLDVIVIAPATLTVRALVIEAVVIESIPPAVIAAELPVMILFAIVISNADTDVAV